MSARLIVLSLCLASAIMGSVTAARGTPGAPALAPVGAYDTDDYDQFSANGPISDSLIPVNEITEVAPSPTSGDDSKVFEEFLIEKTAVSPAAATPVSSEPETSPAPSQKEVEVDVDTLEMIAKSTPSAIHFMKEHPELVPVSAPQMAEIEEAVKDPNQLMTIARGVLDFLPKNIATESLTPESGV